MSDRDEELEYLEYLTKALRLALKSVIKARQRRAKLNERTGTQPKIIAWSFHGDEPIRSEIFCNARALADPRQHEECSALMTVRWIGERLHKIGDQKLMSDTLYKATARQRRHAGHMLTIADHRWDGIGRTGGHAGWCC